MTQIDTLIVIDRDGTVIENMDYLGRKEDWINHIKIRPDVIKMIKDLDKIHPHNIKYIFTNQSGVALGYFSEDTVRKVNTKVNELLLENGINIMEWLYSPEIDKHYADHKKIHNEYVKEKSTRKPNPKLLVDALDRINRKLESFHNIIVIGDSEDDMNLAKNINAKFMKV
ncbi:MAG TPA: HAD-IIIA family hydrolase [Alphaproteobacteria bacterium]|nr:HAD-IIIA family hydrolase [Alphaproteobacteria bacterium]